MRTRVQITVQDIVDADRLLSARDAEGWVDTLIAAGAVDDGTAVEFIGTAQHMEEVVRVVERGTAPKDGALAEVSRRAAAGREAVMLTLIDPRRFPTSRELDETETPRGVLLETRDDIITGHEAALDAAAEAAVIEYLRHVSGLGVIYSMIPD